MKNRLAEQGGRLLVALLAAVVYGLTLSRGAYPGPSAELIARYSGLLSRPSPEHPLWGAVAWLLSRGDAAGWVMRLNLLSLVCAAGSVYFFYGLLAWGADRFCAGTTPKADPWAGRLAGLAGGLSLAFCIPFWIAATRAHFAAFDILLAIYTTWRFLRYLERPTPLRLSVFGALYGMLMVEFATAIVWLPCFVLFYVLDAYRREALKVGGLVRLGLAIGAGSLLYVIAAWLFVGTDGFLFREYKGFWHVLWIYWRDQVLLIGHSLPNVGWALIGMSTVVPAMVCLAVGRRGLQGDLDWTMVLLHIVLTAVTVAVLFNAPFAPWPLLGWALFLVTPYVLSAAAYGYLTAYWYRFFSQPFLEEEPAALRRFRGAARLGAVVAALAAVGVAAWQNAPTADGRDAAGINAYARAVVQSLDGRTWLLSDGVFDNLILIAARERGVPLRVVNLRAADDMYYRNEVASWFDDVSVKALAPVGLMPMVREWFQRDPHVKHKAAVYEPADFWGYVGLTALPHGLVFLGASPEDAAEKGPADASAHEEMWQRAVAQVAPAARACRDKLLDPYYRQATRHLGLVENNYGALLDENGDSEAAYKAYHRARHTDPQNLSAALNMFNLVRQKRVSGDEAAIRREIENIISSRKPAPPIWYLSQYYGYVRMPEAAAEMGWLWAVTGRKDLAARALRSALDQVSRIHDGDAKRLLASALTASGRPESSSLYEELLMENPEDVEALLGLARASAAAGEEERARELLDRAERAHAPAWQVGVIRAGLALQKSRWDEARQLLDKVIQDAPDCVPAWRLLVGLLVSRGDREGLAQVARQIKENAALQSTAVAALAEGYLAFAQDDYERACHWFEKVLERWPEEGGELRERLLALELALGRREGVDKTARGILQSDPDHALANYAMGTIFWDRGDALLAEEYFRRSLRTVQHPAACNDLAWLLLKKGVYEEAEMWVRRALQLHPRMSQAWDTLGVLLTRTGRWDEAADAFDKAVANGQGSPGPLLHWALLAARRGDLAQARKLLSMIGEREFMLSGEDRLALIELQGQLAH